MAESIRGNGITQTFCDNFKKSKFYEVYKKHTDELFIGVRDGYINIYYNCASIAKIRCGKRGIVKNAEINNYYLKDGFQKNNKYVSISEDDFVKHYEHIKKQSDIKVNLEKKSQERLVIDNNKNKNSNWYCLDVEYMKSIDGKLMPWRFDIIAISKESHHSVALIELKYGFDAIGGESGVQKHVKDYSEFQKDGSFEKYLKKEIVNILKTQKKLGVIDYPECFENIDKVDIKKNPKFYFITLDNNSRKGGNTPKMSIGGYLFPDKGHWGSRNVSSKAVMAEPNVKNIKPIFLFATATLDKKGRLTKPINDILDEKNYDSVEKI